MDKEKIKDILSRYKINQSLKNKWLCEINDINEIISGQALQAQEISDMSRGGTNKFHSKTENVAENYEREIEELKSLVKQIDKEIAIVNIWLDYITPEDKFIISNKYFTTEINIKWDKIAKMYLNEFGGEYMQKETIITRRNNIIRKIEEFEIEAKKRKAPMN